MELYNVGHLPSPQELSFIGNACEMDEQWYLTAS